MLHTKITPGQIVWVASRRLDGSLTSSKSRMPAVDSNCKLRGRAYKSFVKQMSYDCGKFRVFASKQACDTYISNRCRRLERKNLDRKISYNVCFSKRLSDFFRFLIK